MDLSLNNLQRLICHKNQKTNQPTNHQNFVPYRCTDWIYRPVFEASVKSSDYGTELFLAMSPSFTVTTLSWPCTTLLHHV